MSQTNMEIKQSVRTRTDIKIFGKFQPVYQQTTNEQKSTNEQLADYHSIKLDTTMGIYCPELVNKPSNYIPVPKKIYVQGSLIAFIDQLDNLWFVSSIFATNINVSVILGRKIKHVSLSQNQCIITNKRNPILFNWGAKKVIDVSNMEAIKINEKMNNIEHYFTAYFILQSHKDDKFYYSNIKKVDNTNKIYQLSTQSNYCKLQLFGKTSMRNRNRTYQKSDTEKDEIYQIIAFPTLERNVMKNKVMGISIGKFHCMCWDICGLLYTWGNRSLALGYSQLPHQKITTTPQLVKKMTKFVTMAFAATHYSLILSSDGHIYQWGIKKLANQLNQQLIFQPKILKIGNANCKIVMLKGKQDQIACLNSRHQLYIWGEKATKFLPNQYRNQPLFQKGTIYQPFRLPAGKDNWKIVDFGIGDQFIALLTSGADSMVMADEEKIYWGELLKRVKGKLKLKTVKTQIEDKSYSKYQMKKRQTMESPFKQVPLLDFCQNFRETDCAVQKSYQQRNIKRQYFKSLKNEKELYLNLLNAKKSNPFNSSDEKSSNIRISTIQLDIDKQNSASSQNNNETITNQAYKRIKLKNDKQIIFKKIKLINHSQTRNSSFNSNLNETKLYLNSMFSETLRKLTMGRNVSVDFQFARRKSQIKQVKKFCISPYEQRLEKVQRKKKSIQDYFNQQMSKTMQENTIEYRMQRHNQILQAKINVKHRNLLKHTLQAYLIKHFIIKILTTPIEQARNIKIQQFAKNLQLSRIEKNLRRVFIKNRVNSRLKKLRPQTYALLCKTFKEYIKRRREKYTKEKKKLISQQIYKYIIQQKIKNGIGKIQLNIRKLQKFRQWLVIIKIQRIKCLKILWKNYLPKVMRINQDSDAIILCKLQDNCTFQSLYKEKLATNPLLKLQTFLNKTPLFAMKYEQYQNITLLNKKDNKTKSQKILKTQRTQRRKQRIKFNGNEQRQCFITLTNIQSSSDFLPYSLHYNIFVRPKSMEVNILQNMKKNDRWINIQKTIFNKCLKQIIQNHQRQFVKAKYKYDRELAYFIKDRYDILSEKRWKCIVQFNQLKQASAKQKKQKQIKEKQLYRLFDLIGMQKILKDDCLPEKYLMLEEALKKKDCPVLPNPYIVFGMNQFKIMLRKYYQNISVQAKQMRNKYM